MYEQIKYLNEQTGTLEDIEQAFFDAFSDANQKENESHLNAETKYSITDEIEKYVTNFKKIINSIKNETFSDKYGKNNVRVEVRPNSPKILLDYVPNFVDLPIVMESNHIKSTTGDRVKGNHRHNISISTLSQIPKSMENPIAIFKHSKSKSINMILDLKDIDNRNIVIVLKPNSYQTYYYNRQNEYKIEIANTNKLVTAFGIGDNGIGENNYIENNVEKIYYPTNLTKEKLIQLVGGESLHHAELTKYSVSTKNNIVKSTTNEAIKEFGTTSNPYKAGYILENGEYLD